MTDRNHIVYLALGDSYTIGTGASHESRNFPSLLAAHVQEATRREVKVVNPAVNGFTTIDVLARELGYITDLKPDLGELVNRPSQVSDVSTANLTQGFLAGSGV